jgi:hypothetical protein
VSVTLVDDEGVRKPIPGCFSARRSRNLDALNEVLVDVDAVVVREGSGRLGRPVAAETA